MGTLDGGWIQFITFLPTLKIIFPWSASYVNGTNIAILSFTLLEKLRLILFNTTNYMINIELELKMDNQLRKVLKKIILSFLPLLALLLTGETVCRLKYYFDSGDVAYLIAPFLWKEKEKEGPKIIKVAKCPEDTLIYSPCHEKLLLKSYNDYCWRGEPFLIAKPVDTYRILVVGGSTVESYANPDTDTWVFQLGSLLNSEPQLKGKVEMINGGKAGSNSKDILIRLQKKGFGLDPDMVVYYEAVNDRRRVDFWRTVDNNIVLLGNSIFGRLHNLLHYKSMLYTYLLEKYNFLSMKKNKYNIHKELVGMYLSEIIKNCKDKSITFVYVKQVSDFPLEQEGISLVETKDIEELLDGIWTKRSEKEDLNMEGAKLWTYVFALEQRLIVDIQSKLCEDEGILVIDPMPLFDLARKENGNLFWDHMHKTCYGERILSECVYEGLRDKVKKEISRGLKRNQLANR